MIQYDIKGGDLPVVICYPQDGQCLKTERGAMSWMSPNMQMSTNAGGGFGGVFGRMVSGESIFMNEYRAVGGPGMIAFASSFPGSILPYQVTPGNDIIVQKGGFLAMVKCCFPKEIWCWTCWWRRFYYAKNQWQRNCIP